MLNPIADIARYGVLRVCPCRSTLAEQEKDQGRGESHQESPACLDGQPDKVQVGRVWRDPARTQDRGKERCGFCQLPLPGWFSRLAVDQAMPPQEIGRLRQKVWRIECGLTWLQLWNVIPLIAMKLGLDCRVGCASSQRRGTCHCEHSEAIRGFR